MTLRIEDSPQDVFKFCFFSQEWELRKDEDFFFKNGEGFSLREFLSSAAASLYSPLPRYIPNDRESFNKLSPANRSRIAIIFLKKITPKVLEGPTPEEEENLAGLASALDWLSAVSSRQLDILSNWSLYKSVYFKREEEAALHMCVQGRAPQYRNPQIEENSAVEIREIGEKVMATFLPFSEKKFSEVWEAATSEALFYEGLHKTSPSPMTEEEVSSAFARRLYSFKGERANLTPSLRGTAMACFQEARSKKTLCPSWTDYLEVLAISGEEAFAQPSPLLLSIADWTPSPYTVSSAAQAQRQTLADIQNWEKFCEDILSLLSTSEDVISSRELIEVAKNHRAVRKWREKGYLVERADLREGRRTYWYCPLLEPASADFKNMI